MMKKGLLWFDNDRGRDLAQKVKRAARRYERKFGCRPNVCYVHPSVLNGNSRRVGSVRLEPLQSVLRDHFWVGEEREN
ncbi:MAG: hypothetical protein PVH62_02345 [Anaerolineae bacterium]|jgi:hypothetical protein